MNLLIVKNLFKPKKRIVDWVPLERLEWSTLSKNPNAIDMFYGNEDKVCFKRVAKLETAIGFIKANLHRLDDRGWANLNKNPKAIGILLKNPERVNISKICKNPNGMSLLFNYIKQKGINDEAIDIIQLHLNPSAVDLLNKRYNTDKNSCFIIESYIELMLGNPNAHLINIIKDNIDFLVEMNVSFHGILMNKNPYWKELILNNIDMIVEQREYTAMSSSIFVNEIYIDKLHIFNKDGVLIDQSKEHMVDWTSISKNEHATEIIKSNPDKVIWRYVCSNPAAIEIIKNNMDKINWNFLSLNPNIFEDDSLTEWYNMYNSIIDKIMA